MPEYPIPVQYDSITGEDLNNLPRATVTPKNTFDEIPIEDRTSAGYLDALLGAGGRERFQLWPERMVRSALSAAGEAVEGKLPVDRDPITGKYFSEIDYEPNWIAKNIFGSGNFRGPAEGSIIERAQDVTGAMGMSSMPFAPKGALGAAGGKFYSTLENTIANSKVEKATPEQWQAYLKNQPGIKPEELEFSLAGLPQKQLTKAEIQQYINENGIKLGEVWKGDLKFNKDSPYALPEVIKAAREAGNNPGELELVLANDGNAYRALTKKFPKLGENENWAELVSKSVFGGDTMPTGTSKFHSYQLAGGENYRELLLTVPKKQISKEAAAQIFYETYNRKGLDPAWNDLTPRVKEAFMNDVKDYMRSDTASNYQSSHWDEPNVLAHIRMNNREVPGVGKTLHIEEIQSDWHQAGRKQGYSNPEKFAELNKKLEDARNDLSFHAQRTAEEVLGMSFAKFRRKNLGSDTARAEAIKKLEEYRKTDEKYKEAQTRFDDLHLEQNKVNSSIPNAPFKKTWDELALKRTLTEAVNNGYDAISWTPGEAQAARYDLSKHYDNINIVKRHDGTYNVLGKQRGERDTNPIQDNVPENKLSDIVGKELAEKAVKGQEEFKGADLKIGGEGMKAFYDKMLVDKANALVKKMGGKVEYEEIEMPKPSNLNPKFEGYKLETQKIPLIRITPQMREKIKSEGFPLYSSGVPVFTPVDDLPFDPEGDNYDYYNAKKAGIKPDDTGHWSSRDPKTGLILKGKNHPTFDKTIKAEEEAGYEIVKKGNRYYSFPKKKFIPVPYIPGQVI